MKPHDAKGPPMPAKGFVEGLARRLVRQAAFRAPASLSDRLEEEWLADFSSRIGWIAQLSFAIGCCWATRVIAQDFCVEKLPATSTAATGEKVLMARAPLPVEPFSRRTIIFLLIVGLHVFLVYALKTGLGARFYQAIPESMQWEVVPEVAESRDPVPPPAQPEFARPFVDIPIPDFRVDEVPDSITITQVTPQETVKPLPTLKASVDRVAGGPGKGFPATGAFYPADARRAGEQGIAVARVCVDPRGRLTEAPVIARSSGYARLDDAALRLARAGSGHYRPTKENGLPVDACYSFRINFQLTE